MGWAAAPFVGLGASTLRLRARDAAAHKLDVGDALVESGALLAALEADAVWARASCVPRASPVAVAQLLVCGRARRCHADFLAAARCAAVKSPAALRGGFDLCRLALEDASLDPTLRKEAVAALGGYLGEEAAPEEPDLELTETWGAEVAAKPADEEDELELDETWRRSGRPAGEAASESTASWTDAGGAPGEDGPAGEAEPESDLELDETRGAAGAPEARRGGRRPDLTEGRDT